jgi:predicted nucleotidyltransferase
MNIKEGVIKALNNLYEKYKNDGLEAIYLWGSITTGEFNEEKSDVDSIGIVNKNSTVKEVDLISELKETGIPDFNIRLINEEDFRTGKPNPENIITTVMFPTVLLFDLPNWEHVVGREFKISDFRDEPITVSDVINERIKRISKDEWNQAKKVAPEVIVYYLKELLRLIHLRQIDRGVNAPFSMKNITDNANEQEGNIITIFKELKETGYSQGEFLKHTKILDEFVKSIFDTYKK